MMSCFYVLVPECEFWNGTSSGDGVLYNVRRHCSVVRVDDEFFLPRHVPL